MSESTTATELQQIYHQRFASTKDYRNRVWEVLVRSFFNRYIKPDDVVLDLGCGYGEFINNISCRKKYAMDLNPDATRHLNPDVELIQQDCSSPWNLPDGILDTVFTSNFFEHLPSKDALSRTLQQAARALRPGGQLIAMGPNIRVINGSYWDFWDHHLALSDRSIAEVLRLNGFQIRQTYSHFLPFTLVGSPEYPLWMLRLYLKLPFVRRLFGGQFLVIATR